MSQIVLKGSAFSVLVNQKEFPRDTPKEVVLTFDGLTVTLQLSECQYQLLDETIMGHPEEMLKAAQAKLADAAKETEVLSEKIVAHTPGGSGIGKRTAGPCAEPPR